MSKRNKRAPNMVAARSSRASARIAKSIPASKSRKASFAEGLRFFIRENVRVWLMFVGTATLLQAFVPWTNDRSDSLWFIVIGSTALALSIPRRFWT